MSSLSALTGQPRRLTVAGKSYDLHPLTIDDLGQLQSWIDRQFPDPFAVVSEAIGRGSYTVPQQQFLLGQALDRATRPRHVLGTPEADRLVQSIDGVKQLLLISIRKGRPDFSDSDAAELYQSMNMGHLEAAFVATGANQVMGDPKGESPKPKPTGSSGSRRRRK